MIDIKEWWIDDLPVKNRKRALEALGEGDIFRFMTWIHETRRLYWVFRNLTLLRQTGKYEEVLLYAYTSTGGNWLHYSMDALIFLFNSADKFKLRAAGAPIPEQDFFTLYRGVSGDGMARRVESFSWTDSKNEAAWFATRSPIRKPAVFEVTVPNESILVLSKSRSLTGILNEYILKIPLPSKPKRLSPMPEAAWYPSPGSELIARLIIGYLKKRGE